MSSLISTMPPTDLMKQENNSPHSISNISSPTTTIGNGNFSPTQQQGQNQQQLQQRQQPALAPTSVTGGGINSTGNNNGAYQFYGGATGQNASPTEGSTASDSGGLINSINSVVGSNGENCSIPLGTKSGSSSNGGAEDDFAAGIGTSTTYNSTVNFNPSVPSNVSSANNNGNNYCVPFGMMNNINSNITPMLNNNGYNVPESPSKQHFNLMQQPQFPQQHNTNYFDSTSSNSINKMLNPQIDGIHQRQDIFNNYGMPQSAPSFTQTIRNPFEEEEEACIRARSLSAKPAGESPLPSPTFFDHYQCIRRQQMPELPQIPASAFPNGSKEQHLALERQKLPYTFQVQHKRQLGVPYPIPGVGPAHHMGMMMRVPPHYMHMNAMMAAAANGKFSFMRPGHHVFPGPNQMMPFPGRLPSQTTGMVSNAINTNSTTTNTKKEKKKEQRISKKKQLEMQQAAEAEAALQRQASCSVMNKMMMPNGPMITDNNFSPGGRMLNPMEMKQRMQQQNHMIPQFSPNQFKIPGRSPPFQRSIKPMPDQRLLDSGDCTMCKQKINQQRRGIRCTALSQGCYSTYHMECAHLSLEAFMEFLKDQRLEWICHQCQNKKTLYYSI